MNGLNFYCLASGGLQLPCQMNCIATWVPHLLAFILALRPSLLHLGANGA